MLSWLTITWLFLFCAVVTLLQPIDSLIDLLAWKGSQTDDGHE